MSRTIFFVVMRGLDPRIQENDSRVDARVTAYGRPGHDGRKLTR